ncbi:MAG: hypothetical protein JXB48_04415, partial [Candidatus Latescibacteria bacterium]|nr:hypothetical protein [Candidatus Latescibacterota bacterium]
MKKGFVFIPYVLLLVLFTACGRFQSNVLETETFTYIIAKDGKNLQFIDKSSGIDYCRLDKDSYCAQVFLNDTEYNATKASFDGNLLNLE